MTPRSPEVASWIIQFLWIVSINRDICNFIMTSAIFFDALFMDKNEFYKFDLNFRFWKNSIFCSTDCVAISSIFWDQEPVMFSLILRWCDVMPDSHLSHGFHSGITVRIWKSHELWSIICAWLNLITFLYGTNCSLHDWNNSPWNHHLVQSPAATIVWIQHTMTFQSSSRLNPPWIPISFPCFQKLSTPGNRCNHSGTPFLGKNISRKFHKNVRFRNSYDVHFRIDDNRLVDAKVQNLQFIKITMFELLTLKW